MISLRRSLMSRQPYATFEEMQRRHPRELAVVGANEQSREIDRSRVEAALVDVSTEIRAILAARYTPDQLDRCDEDSLGVLTLFCIDMAMYRIALSNARSTEQIRERYETAVKRLEGIAAGRGGLTFESSGGSGSDGDGLSGSISPNEAVLTAPQRMFTRKRFGAI